MEVNRVDDINDAIYKLGVIVGEKTDLTGMSPLHKACQYGRVQNVEKLINEGADVLATNDVYPSVLCRGCIHNQNEQGFNQRDYVEIINLLCSSSRRLLEMKDATGMTAAELAKKYQDNVLQQLLEKKVENLRNEREKAEEKRIRNKPKVRRL
ncbi:hypothetical protein GUITHDRAFT_109849 [Guillardia theta CCMP2712]|uniref:Uncharacterized protein n=1 Tax=Guillardia theta (strain CCMP2712) TaxID=905079 RepID=L1J6B6_GUITC|nr:hypothetical protein GUITHDRAFT_109849 [Guillardia theta CCMP2712]EKX44061.1 hypothetical protein GUITHDRAFT_109849 [Guillardia theta CCMP2712]|eukprot:XP_005831041.1 hypothetical protein GUITHDRAFT_109849 [Guillardia theta CCMP2712]